VKFVRDVVGGEMQKIPLLFASKIIHFKRKAIA
jgi:hypothetical protein